MALRPPRTSHLTNDEIKHRILNIYATFVSDVDADRLSDWLKQENVISIDQWQKITVQNPTNQSRCRALLDYLFSTAHPRAFLVIKEALDKEKHHICEFICNQATADSVDIGEPFDDPNVMRYIKELLNRLNTLEQRIVNLEAERRSQKMKKKKDEEETSWPSSPIPLPIAEEGEKKEMLCNPVLIHSIRTRHSEEDDKWTYALTILSNEIFIVSQWSSVVEVYDALRFHYLRRWQLSDIVDPLDIASCEGNHCLYIMDWKNFDQCSQILRVHPNGHLINSWSVGDDYGRLSTTKEGHVLLTVHEKKKLNEYSPDGQLVQEIALSRRPGFANPWHAVKLTNGHFVVSHGEPRDALHRVCIVDSSGIVKQSFGERSGSTIGRLNEPVYLAVRSNGSVIVADVHNSRVLLLNSDLEFQKVLISRRKHGIRRPRRLFLDESRNRLFVADNKEFLSVKDGRVLVFDLQQ